MSDIEQLKEMADAINSSGNLNAVINKLQEFTNKNNKENQESQQIVPKTEQYYENPTNPPTNQDPTQNVLLDMPMDNSGKNGANEDNNENIKSLKKTVMSIIEYIKEPSIVFILVFLLNYPYIHDILSSYVPYVMNNTLKGTLYKSLIVAILFLCIKLVVNYPLKKK